MKRLSWFRPRGYSHFDVPVGVEWSLNINPAFVSRHSWLPLIHRIKETKRYKPKLHKTELKKRDIMFASHRDASILAKYSAKIVQRLDAWYAEVGLEHTVIAYRPLGKSNYHFAAVVQDYVRAHDPVTILCFDVTGFFDNISHPRLKKRLKWLLRLDELPDDWLKVFRAVTKYRRVEQSDLKANTVFAARMLQKRVRAPLATMEELVASGIKIHKNPNMYGIPQGTPISASMSNLYLAELDQKLKSEAEKRGALYQRYSDDMLVACHPDQADELEAIVVAAVREEVLEQGRRTLAGFSNLLSDAVRRCGTDLVRSATLYQVRSLIGRTRISCVCPESLRYRQRRRSVANWQVPRRTRSSISATTWVTSMRRSGLVPCRSSGGVPSALSERLSGRVGRESTLEKLIRSTHGSSGASLPMLA